MNKKVKYLLIVTPVCFALGGVVLLLCLIDPDFYDFDFVANVVWTVILTVWSFFIVPATIYAINWYAENVRTSFERAFTIGYLWGDIIMALLVISAPVTGVLWYTDTIHALFREKRRKSEREQEKTDGNLFE